MALVSTGSTAGRIEAAGVPVTRVEELTGFPECLDGRVKTLHPRVHAGILADTRNPEHVAQLADLGVEPFDLVVCNLYPFTDTVQSGASQEECVEQIDIGGPSMVRAAAKNHASVAVVTDPAAYASVLLLVRGGGFTLEQRRTLAAEAFVHTATYDVAVASWMGNVLTDTSDGTGFPAWTGATWDKKTVLRYGENPHQRAALYTHWRRRAGQRRAAARQGDVLQQLRRRRRRPAGRRRPRRAGGRDHQARQPVRHRGGGGHRAGPPARARLRPGVRLRRRGRDQPAGHRRDGRAGGRGLHRGRRRARLRARGAGDPHPQEEHPAAAAAERHGAHRRPGRVPGDQRRGADADPRQGRRRGRRRRRRPVALDASWPGTRRTRPPSPTSASPGGRSAR